MPANDDLDTSSSLLRAVRGGNQEAWERFVQRYRPFIYSYCRRLQLPHEDAEDVTQIVLILLSRKLGGFVYDPSKGFRNWLRNIIRKEVWKFWRELFRKWCDRASGDSKDLQLLNELPCPDSLLEPLLDDLDAATRAHREKVEQLQERVKSSVKPSTWQCFWLTAIEGFATKATAELLGMTKAAVYANCRRVRKRLLKEAQRMHLSPPE